MEPEGRVVASDRKRSCTLARGAKLRRGGRQGRERVGFQSLRPRGSVRNEWETEQETKHAHSTGKRQSAGKQFLESVESAYERTSTASERRESRKAQRDQVYHLVHPEVGWKEVGGMVGPEADKGSVFSYNGIVDEFEIHHVRVTLWSTFEVFRFHKMIASVYVIFLGSKGVGKVVICPDL
ncbi:hypothetical protein EDB83DRAFT_2555649 [Lactarius deliciosus]|nr:hypothetical protein EDB83DRAFT_2555649 [Lactarius deliciosus]